MTAVTPFQIRGRSFTAVMLRLAGAADETFYKALDAQLRQAPDFFSNAPFVLDLERARGLDTSDEISRLLKELKGRGLSVFGAQGGREAQTEAAVESGLILLQGGRDVPLGREPRPSPTVAPAPLLTRTEPESDPLQEPASLVITEPVRSGQRVFADRGDLVVIAAVSSGAELIAQGNIHVYGRLRGRALAGVNGDRSARIFCQSLDAELIAIAGLYRTSDDLDPAVRKQRVQAFLREDALHIEALK